MGISPQRYTLSAFVIGGASRRHRRFGAGDRVPPQARAVDLRRLRVPRRARRPAGRLPGRLDRPDRPVLRRHPGRQHAAVAAPVDRLVARRGDQGVLVLSILLVGGWRSRRTLSLAPADGRWSSDGDARRHHRRRRPADLRGDRRDDQREGRGRQPLARRQHPAVGDDRLRRGRGQRQRARRVRSRRSACRWRSPRSSPSPGSSCASTRSPSASCCSSSPASSPCSSATRTSASSGPKVPAFDVPLLSDIPFFGTVLFSHNLSVYGAYVVVARHLRVHLLHTPGPRAARHRRAPGGGVRPRRPGQPAALRLHARRRRPRRRRRGGGQPRPDRRVAGEPDDQPRLDRPGVRHLRRLAPGARRRRLPDLPRPALRRRRAAGHVPVARPGAHPAAVPADDPDAHG